MINEKIKELRKQNNLTQEELADKLCVSRQAITKWESGLGQPDISNIELIAKLFNVTIDELLSNEKIKGENISRTEFDVFGKDCFELDFGVASILDVTLGDSEKVIIELRSDLCDAAYKLAKVKLENGRKINLSVIQIQTDKKYLTVETSQALSKQDAKKHLFIKAIFPKELTKRIEINGNLEKLIIHDINIEKHIEFDGKVSNVEVKDVKGHFELTSNIDMEVYYDGSLDQLDINQLNALTNLYLPKDKKLDVYNKGRMCEVIFDNYENDKTSTNKVELNGRKAELTVRGK